MYMYVHSAADDSLDQTSHGKNIEYVVRVPVNLSMK